jgi:hypothetical protein
MKIDHDGERKECGHIIRLLEPDESYRLEALYGVLDFDGRRNRFGAAICDVSLRSYCRSLDWTRVVVVGAFESRRMDAAIELVPLSAAWDAAEIAVTCFPRWCDDLAVQMLSLALAEIQLRGCKRLLAPSRLENPALSRLLRSAGEPRIEDDPTWIDLKDAPLASARTFLFPRSGPNRVFRVEPVRIEPICAFHASRSAGETREIA